MVDFNSEATISTPAVDIVKVLLIQKSEYVSDAWEDYYKKEYSGISHNLNYIRARLQILLLTLGPYFKRQKKFNISECERLLEKGNKNDLWEITKHFGEALDSMNITRLDLKQKYNHADIETENKVMT